MKILTVTKTVDPVTFEQRYIFTGYITPETIQDAIHESFGMSQEKLGEELIRQIWRLHYDTVR